MLQAEITFNRQPVQVHFVGTDHKHIPSLLQALRNNKLTIHQLEDPPQYIELFCSEAILHSSKGDKYQIPIF